MASQEKITVHNLADLKNTSDDAIPNYLNSLKFKQIHTLTDTRLVLGYSAFLIAAACFSWDYKFGFESTKWYTAAAVALYTIINGALTYWIGLVERGVVYQGVAPSGEKISISTSTKKNVPIYNVNIAITSKSGGKPETIELSRPFTEWFDSVGHFVAPPFQTIFATSVPLIAKVDPKRAERSQAQTGGTGGNSSSFMNVDSDMLDALAAGSTTGADGTGKKSKRRKA
ncbi:microsomal signal peptidase 25 kDa subunit-domain-containing protein [Xylariales sp. AK1849]|nr:microsomal signal peptidase 25 kDa subunit-domain-containing protein [Xylariales sp. AK1849]